MLTWEEYNHSVDIGRGILIDEFEDWADTNKSKRVCSIVAAPGTGKTWLLRAARRKWEGSAASNPHHAERLVFWIDVAGLVNANERNPKDVLNTANVFTALDEWRDAARNFCPKIRPIDPDIDPSLAIDLLVQQLCDECMLPKMPIVLVDAYDEVPPHCNEVLDERILERFYAKECIHLIIGRRWERRLQNDTLHRHQRIMNLGAFDQAPKQFERFRNTYYPSAKHLTPRNFKRWQKSIPLYQWNHPFINAFLFDCALKAGRLGKLSASDLRACCSHLIERPDAAGRPRHPLKPGLFDILLRIANEILDSRSSPRDEWTIEHFESSLHINFRDSDLTPLFDYGVLELLKEKQVYKIMDGLRELLRAIRLLENHKTKGIARK